MIEHDRLYIGGELVKPAGTSTIEVINPYTEEVCGRVPEGTEADIDAAVSAARTAFDSTGWSEMSVADRCAILARASAGIQARMDELTGLISTEMGSPRAGASTFGQVLALSMILDYYASLRRDVRHRGDGARACSVRWWSARRPWVSSGRSSRGTFRCSRRS
ncbi:MAG: aldehyde dehydrogenase family protein [Acidimicrobiales bacterium]